MSSDTKKSKSEGAANKGRAKKRRADKKAPDPQARDDKQPKDKSASRRAGKKKDADKPSLKTRLSHPFVFVGLFVASLVGAVTWFGTGCGGWDPREPLMRNAPEVDRAIELMDAGEHAHAAQLLQDYLGTDACKEGEIGVPPNVRELPAAGFDLGLVLFNIAEKYGERFGGEENGAQDGGLPALAAPPGQGEESEIDERRTANIACALTVVKVIAGDTNVSAELRARAHYLAGNLQFLQKQYEDAVESYDQALQLIPGIAADADGDPLGRDAAWNRAIALRRLQEAPDAGEPDAEPDAEPDGGDDGDEGDGGGEDQKQDGGDQDQDGGQGDAGDEQEQDGGGDDEQEQEQPKPEPNEQDEEEDGGEEPKPEQGPMAESGEESPEQTRMRMILEELEDAKTYQQEEARRLRGNRAGRVLEDK